MSNEKQRAEEALTNLFKTMQSVLDLPEGFRIQATPELEKWFTSSDPAKLTKLIEWAERSAAELR